MVRPRRIVALGALVVALVLFRNKRLAEDEDRFTRSRQT